MKKLFLLIAAVFVIGCSGGQGGYNDGYNDSIVCYLNGIVVYQVDDVLVLEGENGVYSVLSESDSLSYRSVPVDSCFVTFGQRK